MHKALQEQPVCWNFVVPQMRILTPQILLTRMPEPTLEGHGLRSMDEGNLSADEDVSMDDAARQAAGETADGEKEWSLMTQHAGDVATC